MQLIKLRMLSSVVAAMVLAAGISQTALAGKKVKADPLRIRTGVVIKLQEGKMTLDLGKRGDVNVGLNSQSLVWREEAGALAEIKTGAVIRIKGQGAGSCLTARSLVILPATEKLKMLKKSKANPAYGKTNRSVEVKAKVIKLEPLTVMNRNRQTLQVILAPEGRVLQQVIVKPENLKPGMKLQIQYRERKSGNQAIKVIIRLKKDKKQSKS